ncbi:MAG: hypothetical protein HY869_17280 [Chloroflexi bacterium]|nr:hypothetical protein [Chloroflexota bacterium]
MNPLFLWVAAILCMAYGGLTSFAGFGQLQAKKIQLWAAWSLILSGGIVIAAGVMTLFGLASAFWLLLLGLVGIHALAINNGFQLYGRLNPSHHIGRLFASILLFGLTYLVLK